MGKIVIPDTLREIFGQDEVQEVITDFLHKRAEKASGIVILWASGGDIFVNTGGFSEVEAVGVIETGKRMIQDRGLKRK